MITISNFLFNNGLGVSYSSTEKNFNSSPIAKLNFGDNDSLYPIYYERTAVTTLGFNPKKDIIYVGKEDTPWTYIINFDDTLSKIAANGPVFTSTRTLKRFFSSESPVLKIFKLSEKYFYVGRGMILDEKYNPVLVCYIPMSNYKKMTAGLRPIPRGYTSPIIAGMNGYELVNGAIDTLIIEVINDYAYNTDKIPTILKNWINKFLKEAVELDCIETTINLVGTFSNFVSGIPYEEISKIIGDNFSNLVNHSENYKTATISEECSLYNIADFIFNTHEYYNIEELKDLFSSDRDYTLFTDNILPNKTKFIQNLGEEIAENAYTSMINSSSVDNQ